MNILSIFSSFCGTFQLFLKVMFMKIEHPYQTENIDPNHRVYPAKSNFILKVFWRYIIILMTTPEHMLWSKP